MRSILKNFFLALFILSIGGSLFFGWKTYKTHYKYTQLKENGKKLSLDILERYHKPTLANTANSPIEEFVHVQFRDPVDKSLINAHLKLPSELAEKKDLKKITVLYESENKYIILAKSMKDPQKATKKNMFPTYIFIYDTILFGMAWIAILLKKDKPDADMDEEGKPGKDMDETYGEGL